MKLDDTWRGVKESVTQEPYVNGGGLSRKDWRKLGLFGVLVLVAGWVWHDALGFGLPSDPVWEFVGHATDTAIVVVVAGGATFHARRRKP